MPPGVPSDRVAAWQKSFDATMKDTTFQAAAKKVKAGLDPKSGKQLSAFVGDVLSTDKAVFARARELVGIKK